MAVAAPPATEINPSVAAWLKPGKAKLLFIGGRWVTAASGRTFATFNPATGEKLADVAEADKEDIDRAVKAARAAFKDGSPWRTMAPNERGRLLWKLADLLEQHLEEFAQLETLDNGKPIKHSRRDDLPLSIDNFRYYAGWCTKLEGETIPLSAGPILNYTLREPVGVCGQIIPWNYPLMMAAWKLGPALAAGNTVVLKPAEQTPLSALRLGELIAEAGFPDGVVNIVPGFGETAGAALSGHMEVDKIAFTGEWTTGQLIVKASAGNLKRVTLELGGKSPDIVFEDADMESTPEGVSWGIYYNMGQDCTAGSRLFLHRKVYDEVMAGLESEAKKLKLGNGMNPKTTIGPLVSAEQVERVTGYIEIGAKEGARARLGGNRATAGALGKGFFVEPTILEGDNAKRVAREEIFGPVVTVISFKDEEEAVRLANDTKYGLAAGIWTTNLKRAHRVAARIRAGTIWVNCYGGIDAASPFGGYKMSGYGREMGRAGLENYTNVKSVWVDLS